LPSAANAAFRVIVDIANRRASAVIRTAGPDNPHDAFSMYQKSQWV